ncbi:MAG: glutathione S-transferase family protein [Thalassobaculum sp.]|uniref:glutathione S-transferase family protein n=1 Tax=Thalassobaculum sp. TaxID=2022740 RepID=UPI0032EF4242
MPDDPEYTLISHVLCPYVQRAVITLAEKRMPFRRIDIDLADKPDWFRAISPLGRVPVLQVGGTALFESAVIVEYLEETTAGPMHPADPLQKARHRAWIEMASAALDAIAGFYAASDAETFETRRRALADRLGRLEADLGAGPYFSGGEFRLVDAAWAPVFHYLDAFETIAEFGLTDGAPRVAAYRAALAARPSVRDAFAADYPQRLLDFLRRKGSHLSRLMADQPVAGTA